MRYASMVASGSLLAAVPAGRSVTNPSGIGASNDASTSRTASPERARIRSESVHKKRTTQAYHTRNSAVTRPKSRVSGASQALGLGGGGTTTGIPHV